MLIIPFYDLIMPGFVVVDDSVNAKPIVITFNKNVILPNLPFLKRMSPNSPNDDAGYFGPTFQFVSEPSYTGAAENRSPSANSGYTEIISRRTAHN